jgi:D-xylose transport system permease protein
VAGTEQDPRNVTPVATAPEEAAGGAEDLTAAAEVAVAEVPPEILANTLGQYLRGWLLRVRSGDSGVLPVLVAMAVVAIAFEATSPENVFLNPLNLVTIFGLSTVYMVLSMAEIPVLLLGEIDLSIGPVAMLGGVIAFKLVQTPAAQPTPGPGWPWELAIIVALLCSAAMGALQGTLVARLHVPSFVVTLGGFLVFSGIFVVALGGASGSVAVNSGDPNQWWIYNLVQGSLPWYGGWVALAMVVIVFGGLTVVGTTRRRRSGLTAPPPSITAIRIALVVAVGIAVVQISNSAPSGGLPWSVLIVLVMLGLWTFLLQRLRFGRYVYAIGGNPEAARRAGVDLTAVRTWVFVLCSLTAGIAGILYGSFLSFYTSGSADPGQFTLYAVAAAVIGGTSLFGGRGKALHGLLGGLLIGGIAHGMDLLRLPTQWTYIVTGVVLLVAVLVDVVSRRGARTGSVTRA